MCFSVSLLFSSKNQGTEKRCKLCFQGLNARVASVNYSGLICARCAESERKRLRSNNKRRRNKRTPSGRVYMSDWVQCLEQHKFSCAICKKKGRKNLTLDHIKSLSAGGTNTINNIQPLCVRCHEIKDGHKRKIFRHLKRLYRKIRRFVQRFFRPKTEK